MAKRAGGGERARRGIHSRAARGDRGVEGAVAWVGGARTHRNDSAFLAVLKVEGN